MPENLWRAEVFIARAQGEPRAFSGRTREELRAEVYQWLVTARPVYMRSGERSFEKRGGWWSPTGVESDELAYRQFCDTALDIERNAPAGAPERPAPVVRDELWRAEVYTSPEQKEPRVFSNGSQLELRREIYNWLRTTRPRYVRLGKSVIEKGSLYWTPSGAEEDEQAYRELCESTLTLQIDPQKQVKQKAKAALSRWLLWRQIAAFGVVALIHFVGGSLIILLLLTRIYPGMPYAVTRFILTVILPMLAVAGGCAVVLWISVKILDAGTKPRFHRWFETYGVQALATVVDRQLGADADGDPEYFLLLEWQHPREQQPYTRRVQLSGRHYFACPVGSTHPVLLDPDNTGNYEVYLSQIRARDAMSGNVV